MMNKAFSMLMKYLWVLMPLAVVGLDWSDYRDLPVTSQLVYCEVSRTVLALCCGICISRLTIPGLDFSKAPRRYFILLGVCCVCITGTTIYLLDAKADAVHAGQVRALK